MWDFIIKLSQQDLNLCKQNQPIYNKAKKSSQQDLNCASKTSRSTIKLKSHHKVIATRFERVQAKPNRFQVCLHTCIRKDLFSIPPRFIVYPTNVGSHNKAHNKIWTSHNKAHNKIWTCASKAQQISSFHTCIRKDSFSKPNSFQVCLHTCIRKDSFSKPNRFQVCLHTCIRKDLFSIPPRFILYPTNVGSHNKAHNKIWTSHNKAHNKIWTSHNKAQQCGISQ